MPNQPTAIKLLSKIKKADEHSLPWRSELSVADYLNDEQMQRTYAFFGGLEFTASQKQVDALLKGTPLVYMTCKDDYHDTMTLTDDSGVEIPCTGIRINIAAGSLVHTQQALDISENP